MSELRADTPRPHIRRARTACPCGQSRYSAESGDFLRLSLCGNAVRLGFPAFCIQTEGVELAVERRAADAQSARDLRHLPAIVGNGVPNKLSFELFERAHLAV